MTTQKSIATLTRVHATNAIARDLLMDKQSKILNIYCEHLKLVDKAAKSSYIVLGAKSWMKMSELGGATKRSDMFINKVNDSIYF